MFCACFTHFFLAPTHQSLALAPAGWLYVLGCAGLIQLSHISLFAVVTCKHGALEPYDLNDEVLGTWGLDNVKKKEVELFYEKK
jgi:hypothetical protein